MKIWEVYDEEQDLTVAFLFYSEMRKEFYTEIPEDIDEWNCPFFFMAQVQRGNYSIDNDLSLRWVRSRIVPTDRQNISQILRDNHLGEYDEYKLLVISQGRCAQDFLCIKETSIEKLPEEIRNRMSYRVKDAMVTEKGVLVFFENGETKRYRLDAQARRIATYGYLISHHEEYINEMKVCGDGFGIEWLSNIFVSYKELYEFGETVDVDYMDFVSFVKTKTMSTPEAVDYLGCSRQNVEDLVRRGKIKPVKSSAKFNLFLDRDIKCRI